MKRLLLAGLAFSALIMPAMAADTPLKALQRTLRARRGLDHVRSDQPQGRRRQSDPGRRRARHSPGNARIWQFRWTRPTPSRECR
jgi:hypothetical protein